MTGRIRRRAGLPYLAAAMLVAALAPASHDALAQLVSPANGAPVCTADSAQTRAIAVSDGAGGAFVFWTDARRPDGTYVQRLTSGGSIAAGWPDSGLRIPCFPDNRVAAADDHGGAFVTGEYYGIQMPACHITSEAQVSRTGYPYGVGPSVPGGESSERAHATTLAPDAVMKGEGFRVPAIASDGAGGAFLSWTHDGLVDSEPGIVHFTDGAMTRQPAYTFAQGLTFNTVVCTDAAGGAYFVRVSSDYDLYADHLLANGTLDPLWTDGVHAIAAGPGIQGAPGVIPDGAAGFYLVWEDGKGGAFDRPFVERVTVGGHPAPGWPSGGVSLSPFPTSAAIHRTFEWYLGRADLPYSAIVSDGADGAFVAWMDYRDSAGTGSADLYAQHIRADGMDPAWPRNGAPICVASGDQTMPRIAPDGAGGLFAVWQDFREGTGPRVFAQRLGAAGTPAPGWPADGIPICAARGAQTVPDIVSSGPGAALVVWTDGRGATPQIYSASIVPDAPVPVLVSLVSADATPDWVHLDWRVGRDVGSVSIERWSGISPWAEIAVARPDGTGDVDFTDRAVVPGNRYAYRITVLATDAVYRSDETWVEVPRRPALSLEGLRPNPATDRLVIAFSLARDEPVHFEVLDVAGRVLSDVTLSPGPGSHIASLGSASRLPPGVCFVRMTQGRERLVRRGIIAR